MKQIIVILSALVLLTGCEKTYNCTVTTKVGESVIETKFKIEGTRKDIKELQETISTNQTLDCK